ncbi:MULTISPECIES: helix-turn-helix domain-containing protein [unclassified Streptomyces]|uniref:winged helix-turn-helix transcriptional regulator n=1 Tax=unclassified Streptomyces TaxID=2593676 RepID=UPI002DDBF066|nr:MULTISPECIES: helix-turn-helix domain-containing protein [unclassified Streptomyces]WSA94536.1 helix-turn-helix transcriptional regulator [Streptomyces sp. NBC_01795]WSB78956.1 helix-turn-helix transcriptional regulator [Streptomyces sp. NBC_01775]WSS12842.1 helix-turn-helix transcriptional regulator [Streptomyces sp. NBC_01186]WSS41626.1 helix-turn-helix transcriptional regulator [Streptomyces sp. NBC_01187]
MAARKCQTTFVSGLDAALDVVGGKWKGLILWALSDGPKRFSQLRRCLSGVSEKMLIQHLRELERDEAVHREVHHAVPPKVEYSLTPTGSTLIEALRPLGDWGTEHRSRLETVRGALAAGNGAPGKTAAV